MSAWPVRTPRGAVGFERAEFMRWYALLAAAEEQPFPTPALKRAIAAIAARREEDHDG